MRKGIQITLGLLLTAVIVSGCSSNDVQRHADLSEIDVVTQANVIWSKQVGAGSGDFYSRLQPVYDNGTLYVADRHGLVKALNAENGATIWQRELSEEGRWLERMPKGESVRISAGPVLEGNRLYLPSENGMIYALNKDTGESLWTTQLKGEVVSAPAVAEGHVVAHLSNGFVIALHEEDGSPVWDYEEETSLLGLRGTSTPAITNGGVVVGAATGNAIVLLLEGGRLAWEQRVSAPVGSSELERMVDVDGTPLVVGSSVYLSAFNGETISLALMSGEIEWKRDYASSRELQILRNRLLVVTQESHVISADRLSGNERWRNSELYYRSLTEPTLQGNYFVVGDRFGYLHWLNIDSGRIEGRLMLKENDPIHSAPVSVEDNIAVQTASGRVYLIENR